VKIGELFRYGRPYGPTPDLKDGLRNFFAATQTPGQQKMILLEAGINVPAIVEASEGKRLPVLTIRSSPHKSGSEATPWEDVYRPDFGHIRYFGDNRTSGRDPASMNGNAAMLAQHSLHHSAARNERLKAAPVVAFRSETVDKRAKGQISFQGFGLIERCERVVQIEPKSGLPFTNYVYDILVADMSSENEMLDWRWISDRRDPSLSAEQALRHAPKSWRQWVNSGTASFGRIRRSVSRQMVVPSSQQKPPASSREDRILTEIYRHYEGRKHRFEAVAAFVTERILSASGVYHRGWITPGSGDNGIDFVGRLDVGSDLARVKMVILGQAKCEKPTAPTNGRDIARTVARLRRGWIGVYVTTSFFSENTQLEVLEDQYPILMVDGYRLAREVWTYMLASGLQTTEQALNLIDGEYDALIARRSPEEILMY
jgi:hypothetical protein